VGLIESRLKLGVKIKIFRLILIKFLKETSGGKSIDSQVPIITLFDQSGQILLGGFFDKFGDRVIDGRSGDFLAGVDVTIRWIFRCWLGTENDNFILADGDTSRGLNVFFESGNVFNIMV